jgi:hypothetical protein
MEGERCGEEGSPVLDMAGGVDGSFWIISLDEEMWMWMWMWMWVNVGG